MFNSKYVISALVIFVIIFTMPFWLNFTSDKYEYPKVALPTGEGMEECIESKEFMRSEHMALLNEWRDEALRNGNRVYVASNGKKWDISLQNTCQKCHANQAEFCDTCHNQNSVAPYCWSCHLNSQGNN